MSVNSEWLAANPIPESETRWGTFDVLRDEAQEAMREIYEELQQTIGLPDSIEQQGRDFYFTGMRYDLLADRHRAFIATQFAAIDAMQNTADLSRMIGTFHGMSISVPWLPWVDLDHDDSSRHILHLDQSGLTLPDRDYYLSDDAKMAATRDAFKEYTQRVLQAFPALASGSDVLWRDVFVFEKELAEISRSSADLRDIETNFNKVTFAELASTYPALNWQFYAECYGWQPTETLSIGQPEFLAFVNAAVSDHSLDSWKVYLKWHLLNRYLAHIDTTCTELKFSFFGRVLGGTTELRPLWKRVVVAAEHALGDAIGRLYVEEHFPESSKQQVQRLVEDVRTAYAARIDALDWMGDSTKAYAKKKLANIKVLIGYPDEWRDYSTLTINTESHVGNVVAADRFEVAYWLGKLHQPASRDDWMMTPQTVNAYNDPNRLVICFPAAILQAPFFSPQATLAENMGGIGTVIGHELTHGFDDQGCQFDAEGNVKQWQTDEERAAFAKRAQTIVEQADQFEVLPGLCLRGKLVLGESIADLGGIEIALTALEMQQEAALPLDDQQRFFISYAMTERCALREAKKREYALADPHPISEFRVNAILQHVDRFYEAFDVSEGDGLYRLGSERARIW